MIEEVKATQLPDPVTYHLLCAIPKSADEFDSGLAKAEATRFYEELLSPVLFVMKMGPDAYSDRARFPSGPSCKVGDLCWYVPTRARG